MVDRKFGVIRFALISGQPSDPTRRYDRAVPFWTWIPLVILLVLLLLLGSIVVLGRVRNGRYLRPVVAFLSKVPLFRKGFEKMSEAAIERYNPELGSAMKKLKRAGADRDPMQAQKALSTLTTEERKAYMEAAGQQQGADEQPMNREQRRAMERMQKGKMPAPQQKRVK